ncbi:peptide ABC transporter ATP-binding protein [Halobacteriales archaeon QH_10_67_22]|nr:MAG: peptide ABC transporter ATP-binding protein [Halobacteriales archaeon QH_10_67_22]
MSDTRDPGDATGQAGRTAAGASAGDDPLLRVEGLTKLFKNDSGFLSWLTVDRDADGVPVTADREWVRAVEDVSFEIRRGETLGLVGESGCGKSTLARTLLRLIDPTEGDVYFEGDNLAELSGEALRRKRKDMQIIFQDPQSSLDPRMKVGPIVEEPMRAHDMLDDEGREERARELLSRVGLDPQHYNRHPHAFSGGQRQRINLARALSVNPDFVVCDEPTSALDASIQAQVLNTMRRLQEEFGLTYLFISHDLSVIRHISDRVAVMYLGEVVELADKEELYENPQHPYTQALLDSIPVPDPRESETRGVLEGDVPSPIEPPSGCRFRTRCPELIAPAEYDLTDAEWAAVRAFTRRVVRHGFEMTTQADLEAEFFGDTRPGGPAGEALDRAFVLLERKEPDAAADHLRDSFIEPSICAREQPSYEVDPEYGDGRHFCACHLQRDEELTH